MTGMVGSSAGIFSRTPSILVNIVRNQPLGAPGGRLFPPVIPPVLLPVISPVILPVPTCKNCLIFNGTCDQSGRWRASSADNTPRCFAVCDLPTSISLSSMRAFLRGETLNMAMPNAAHNRTNVRFGKIVRTIIEPSPRIFRECFCVSGS
jgi:hypothetical protein